VTVLYDTQVRQSVAGSKFYFFTGTVWHDSNFQFVLELEKNNIVLTIVSQLYFAHRPAPFKNMFFLVPPPEYFLPF